MERRCDYIVWREPSGEVRLGAVHANPAESRHVKHLGVHSPDGFESGYAGSGPAELAYCLLADFFNETDLRERPRTRLWHQAFKEDFIAPRQIAGGESYTITVDQIDEWVALAPLTAGGI